MQVLPSNVLPTLFCLYGILNSCVFASAVRFEFVSDQSPGFLCEGSRSSFHLRCDVVNLSYNQSVYWYRRTQHEEMKAIYQDGELLTDGLPKAEQMAYSIGTISLNEIEILSEIGSGRLLHLNNYTCVVLSIDEQMLLSSSGLILNVLFPPDIPECMQDPPKPSPGTLVNLTCLGVAGNHPTELQWTRNNKTVTSLIATDTESTMLLNYSFILQENDYGASFSCETKWTNCDKGSETKICSIRLYDNEDEYDDNKTVLYIAISISVVFISIIILVFILYLLKNLKSKKGNTASAPIQNSITSRDPPITGVDNLASDQDYYMTLGHQQESEYCTVQNIQNEHNLEHNISTVQQTQPQTTHSSKLN